MGRGGRPGDVALGGCLVFGEVVPEWRCRRCRFEWATSLPWKGYRPEEGTLADAKLSMCADEDVVAALEVLDARPKIVPAPEWPGELQGIREAGLYSWWVDEAGASDIAEGLGVPITPGRIYAGQAGATRWPSGTLSTATLDGRIRSQHLGGNIYGSTFRLTLASCLATPLELESEGRKRLAPGGEQLISSWIQQHLSVAVHPNSDRDALENLEHRVLGKLDPPLNLRGMDPSPIRVRLQECRRVLLAPGSYASHRSDTREPIRVAVPRSAGSITLHEEIADILREYGNRWMITQVLADEVNQRGRYRKRDGSAVTAFQIHGRTRNYGRLFERDGSRVRLREPGP